MLIQEQLEVPQHTCYRPQRSCEGYVFTGVCLSTGGEGVPDQVHPPRSRHPLRSRYTPLEQTPPDQVHPLGQGTPPPWDQVHPPGPGTHPHWSRHPPDQVHPHPVHTPWDQVHPPRYGHCCGRSASYWNAFLYFRVIAL